MRVGACNKWVTLSRSPNATTDGPWTDLDPVGSWAAIEPLPPGSGVETRSITHQVRMRYHPEVTIDTRIQYADGRTSTTRSLYVRGVQSVNEQGDELRLLCEEIV